MPVPASRTARTELLLHRPDGSPWRLSVSPGMERFIGAYARLPELERNGAILRYAAADAA